jgi:ABC-type transport system involved in Fe-S cluster assembly fused permease/ATPase subunit
LCADCRNVNPSMLSNAGRSVFLDVPPSCENEESAEERGVQLSGGQRQRVAIARALLINCRILLLDEATSALDAESEHLVQQAIEKAVVGRTVIIVAHRLSTIRQADQIVVMDNHRVVNVGRHDALMTKCSKYHDLIKSQSVIIRDVSKSGLDKMLAYVDEDDEES